MTQLSNFRFPADQIEFRPVAVKGNRAMAGSYVDVRLIQQALDALCPHWQSGFSLTHTGNEYACVCRLDIDNVVRSDTGTGADAMTASNQAFRRAAAAHGLGRYLWLSGQQWEEFDPQRKQFTPQALQRLRNGLGDQSGKTPASWRTVEDAYQWAVAQGHANDEEDACRALHQVVTNDLGGRLTKENFPAAMELFYANRVR